MRKQDRKHIISKRFQAEAVKVNETKEYDPIEALDLVKSTASAKFDETVEVAIKLGIDTRQSDQTVRGTTELPNGTGKTQRVAVFAKGADAEAAQAAGADTVGDDDLIAKIQNGWRDFDVLVATQAMMPAVSKLGRTLGPRMPSPKSGTVTNDVAKVVTAIKKATRLAYRAEKGGIVHAPIGKASFPTNQLIENMNILVDTLLKAKPSGAKGRYVQKITVSSTMGPGVGVDIARAQALATGKGL